MPAVRGSLACREVSAATRVVMAARADAGLSQPQSPPSVAALPNVKVNRGLGVAERCQCLGACPRAGMA